MKGMRTLKIKCTFTEECLATQSGNKALFSEYIASKAPDAKTMEEEIEDFGTEEISKRSMTIFPRENDNPYFYNYWFKGFFKDTCSALSRIGNKEKKGKKDEGKDEDKNENKDIEIIPIIPSLSSKLTAFKKNIDGLIFVKPRKIFINVPKGKEITTCERPLRAETPLGPRVCLAISEALPEGSWFNCEIILLDPRLRPVLIEWLDYGEWRGLGQWRNGGKGSFIWEEIK